MSAEQSDISPRDRGQIRLMREAGLTVADCARYFGVSEAAAYRALEELRATHGPEKVRGTPKSAEEVRAERLASLQARAIELANELNRLLGWLCEHPGNGRGSCMEQAWDLVDEAVWLLDPADDRPVPRVREKAEVQL
jgi:transposase-like protein